MRLRDVIALDERVEAYLDAARTARDAVWPRALAEAEHGGWPGGLFLAASLALAGAEGGGDAVLRLLLAGDDNGAPSGQSDADGRGAGASVPQGGTADAADTARSAARAITAALAWADRAAARPAIDHLLAQSAPLPRAVAIAALGARRADPGEHVLARLTADPHPLPRARAFRTIGQLGRAALKSDLATAARTDPDPECRFWAAWSAARMGAEDPLRTLSEVARGDSLRADAALNILLHRLPVAQANAWLRDFASGLPARRRSLIRATGIVGDPLYIAWLIERMAEPEAARLAGEAFSMITGLDLAYRDLDRDAPAGFQSGPNDDPADENVALDEDGRMASMARPRSHRRVVGGEPGAVRGRHAVLPRRAESGGGLARRPDRRVPAPTPRRGARAGAAAARRADVRGAGARPPSARATRPRCGSAMTLSNRSACSDTSVGPRARARGLVQAVAAAADGRRTAVKAAAAARQSSPATRKAGT